MLHDLDILVFLSVLNEERDYIGEYCRAVFTNADIVKCFPPFLDIVDVSSIDCCLYKVTGDLGEDVGLMALTVKFVDQGEDCIKPCFILILDVKRGSTPDQGKYFIFGRLDELT